MSTHAARQLAKRQALGTTMAASPAMKDAQQRVASWFGDGVPEDEIRRRLEAEALSAEFGLRALLGLNRKAMRLKAADAVVYVAKSWARRLGNKRMSAALSDLARAAGVEGVLADYHIAWYKTGTPPPIGANLLGGVARLAIGPKGQEAPMVVAAAGPMSDPEAIADEFLERCYREFPQAFARKEHAERDAERVRLFAEGATDFAIAKAELERDEWSLRATTTREYNSLVRSRANSITQARKRWLEYVTNTVETVSRNPE